jgi:hypothetical protein
MAVNFEPPVGRHIWRATGITIYLENDGRYVEVMFFRLRRSSEGTTQQRSTTSSRFLSVQDPNCGSLHDNQIIGQCDLRLSNKLA